MSTGAEYSSIQSRMRDECLQRHSLTAYYIANDKAQLILSNPPIKPRHFCTDIYRVFSSELSKFSLLKLGVASTAEANNVWTDSSVDFRVRPDFSDDGHRIWVWTSTKGDDGSGPIPAEGKAKRMERDALYTDQINPLGLSKRTATILERRSLSESQGGIPRCETDEKHEGLSFAESKAVEALLDRFEVTRINWEQSKHAASGKPGRLYYYSLTERDDALAERTAGTPVTSMAPYFIMGEYISDD